MEDNQMNEELSRGVSVFQTVEGPWRLGIFQEKVTQEYMSRVPRLTSCFEKWLVLFSISTILYGLLFPVIWMSV